MLPATTELREHYKEYRIPPLSNALTQFIAIGQAALSSRQVYLNYSSSIRENGLSSPYLVVIPYFLMSLLNLVANTFVGSYS